ncbi:hypothetical protein GCM10022286_04170 [Gryllotalpicola daejeonensis]|uniref:Carbohydrate kinase PfkB domain-containing protein n=1 Tax=Gryllotalpicola daejeonensis TaxID=993087 RepID=A0ABP7ZEI5_9MICO
MLINKVGDARVRVLVNGPASWNVTARVGALPEPVSQTLFAERWSEGVGGTSAGKSLTLAALGAEVVLQTVVGVDEVAGQVLRALEVPGVEVRATGSVSRRTERHLNLLDASGGRVSIYLELPQAQQVHQAAPPTVDPDVTAAVLDLCDHSVPLLSAYRSIGVPVWCDVHDDDGAADGYARPFTAAADVVVASEVRLADVDSYLRDRIAEGAQLAVCTRGGDGARAVHADETGERWYDVGPAPADEVVDTEGAGDAFVAGLLMGLSRGAVVPQALAEASAAGAIAVASAGLGASAADAAAVARLAEAVEVTVTRPR